MTESEKIKYLQGINAFDFTSNFYSKFDIINDGNFIIDQHEKSFNTLRSDANIPSSDVK